MNTIDELFDKDPEDLTPGDIDEIIKYERQARMMAESGVKVKKAKGDGPKIDLSSIVAGIGAKAEKPREPLSKSVRRV
jgi:hypothetical protein